MPDKDYEIVLREDVRIIVTVRMVGGRVVSFVKRWLDVDSFEHALTLAIEDFKSNHEKYLGSR